MHATVIHVCVVQQGDIFIMWIILFEFANNWSDAKGIVNTLHVGDKGIVNIPIGGRAFNTLLYGNMREIHHRLRLCTSGFTSLRSRFSQTVEVIEKKKKIIVT